MPHFCTLFDSNYLLKGVAMLRTLKLHCPEARTYVLCMDEATREILERLSLLDVSCISLAEVEDDELLAVKPGRNKAEYCWTLSPCLPWYVLHHNPEVDVITYLDADLFFYSSVQPLIEEIGEASIAVIEHRYAPQLKHLEINGRFCVEWVSFRRDNEGMACLARWREQCIEWCFYRFEENRMGDQKYLDEWPEAYNSLHILMHPGAGVAPWNYSQYRFEKCPDGRILVEGQPLVFYHFHQFQLLSNGGFDRLSNSYTTMGVEPDAVYRAYELALLGILQEVRAIVPNFSAGLKPVLHVKSQRLAQYLLPRPLKQLLKKFIKAV